jgi:hypothetical protein
MGSRDGDPVHGRIGFDRAEPRGVDHGVGKLGHAEPNTSARSPLTPLLRKIAGWLRPEGWFLGTTGHRAWTGVDEDWLGGGAAMWWSHPDAATSRQWMVEAGLRVEREEFVPEGDSGHALFWARRGREGFVRPPARRRGGT